METRIISIDFSQFSHSLTLIEATRDQRTALTIGTINIYNTGSAVAPTFYVRHDAFYAHIYARLLAKMCELHEY